MWLDAKPGREYLGVALKDVRMRWFKPIGIVFRPASIAGWAISLLVLALCLNVFVGVDARSHSVSDTLYGVFPYWVPTLLAWLWLARRTSEPSPYSDRSSA